MDVQQCVLLMLTYCSFLNITYGGRVLMMSLDSWSHVIRPLTIGKHLEEYGHNVDFLVPQIFAEKIRNFGLANASMIIRPTDSSQDRHAKLLKNICTSRAIGGFWEFLSRFEFKSRDSKKECNEIFDNAQLVDNLKSNKYDLIITDSFMSSGPCHSLLAYKLGVPFVTIGTTTEFVNMGIPSYASVTPKMNTLSRNRMSFPERILNFMFPVYDRINPSTLFANSLVKKIAPEKPEISIDELNSRSVMFVIDQDPILDFPRPSMPNVKFIGGLVVSEGKPLPPDLQKFMDESTNGAIVVSFGSIADSLTQGRIDVLMRSLLSITDLRIVYKYQGQIVVKSDNIFVSEWIPQNDLLAHTNTKLFVTHCGNNGQYEALYHAVPMIGIPLFQDQFGNCQRMAKRGFGICLNFCYFTEKQFLTSVRSIVNGNHKQKITIASDAFRNRPELPGKMAAFWVDHVMKYGGEFYANPALAMSWIELNSIDVMLVLLLFCLTCFQLLKNFGSYFVLRLFNGIEKDPKEKEA